MKKKKLLCGWWHGVPFITLKGSVSAYELRLHIKGAHNLKFLKQSRLY